MKRISVISALAALTLAPLAAQAFTATNYLKVRPVGGGVFEVIGRPAATTGDYWCAAGQYLSYNNNTSATQRIYVVRGLGPSETTGRSSAVQFSTQDPGVSDGGFDFVLSVKRVGDNLKAGMARSYCYDPRVRSN